MDKPDVLKNIKFLNTIVLSSKMDINTDLMKEKLALSFNYIFNVTPSFRKNDNGLIDMLIQDVNTNLVGLHENKDDEGNGEVVIECTLHAQMIFQVTDTEMDIEKSLEEYQWYYEAIASLLVNEMFRESFKRTPFSLIPLPVNI
ncbi:MAG: hypothetical protein KAW14_03390 [Candidatus Aegiribacteria sp.]|nr:hypothetical protein [Candidatus Aegiribacteria sp.]